MAFQILTNTMHGSKIKNKLWTVVADSKSFEEQAKNKSNSEIIILTHKPKYTFLPQAHFNFPIYFPYFLLLFFLFCVFSREQFGWFFSFFSFADVIFAVLKHLCTDIKTVEQKIWVKLEQSREKNELSYMSTVEVKKKWKIPQ